MSFSCLYGSVFGAEAAVKQPLGSVAPVQQNSVPARIVSTSLASDEVLIMLKDRQIPTLSKNDAPKLPWRGILAVSNRAVLPEESNVVEQARQIPLNFGGEPEAILAMEPDLIIAASFNRPELLSKLRAFKVPILLLKNFDSFTDLLGNIGAIGKAIGQENEAKQMQKQFRDRLQQIQRRIPIGSKEKGVPVLIYGGRDQIMAGETMANEIVTAAGGANLAAAAGLKKWPTVTPEKIAAWSPRYVIAAGSRSQRTAILKQLIEAPGWRQLEAIKQQKVILIPNQWMNSLSPFVLDAVDQLQQDLYPR